jgi:drug/metabolite transporter (DMT)-like permease
MKTAIVIAVAVIAQAVGNTLFSKAMKSIAALPSFSDGFSLMMLVEAFRTPLIWVGVILLLIFFACYLSALSWADLSFVLPATASGYILNVFLAHQYLGEPVSPSRWFGSVLIVAGIILVSWSRRKSGEEVPVKAEAPAQGTKTPEQRGMA